MYGGLCGYFPGVLQLLCPKSCVCVSVHPHEQANFQYAENKPLCDK